MIGHIQHKKKRGIACRFWFLYMDEGFIEVRFLLFDTKFNQRTMGIVFDYVVMFGLHFKKCVLIMSYETYMKRIQLMKFNSRES